VSAYAVLGIRKTLNLRRWKHTAMIVCNDSFDKKHFGYAKEDHDEERDYVGDSVWRHLFSKATNDLSANHLTCVLLYGAVLGRALEGWHCT
jgi:hypothetical protein